MEVQADVCQRSTGPNGQCRVGRLLADDGGDAGSETDDSRATLSERKRILPSQRTVFEKLKKLLATRKLLLITMSF